MKVTLSQKISNLQLISQVLGTLAGLMGATRVAMILAEKCETYTRSCCKIPKSADDRKFETFTDAWKVLTATITQPQTDKKSNGHGRSIEMVQPKPNQSHSVISVARQTSSPENHVLSISPVDRPASYDGALQRQYLAPTVEHRALSYDSGIAANDPRYVAPLENYPMKYDFGQ